MNEEYWEDLRSIANIFIYSYTEYYPGIVLKPILGKIAVDTQFLLFKSGNNKTNRQDFKITGNYIHGTTKQGLSAAIDFRASARILLKKSSTCLMRIQKIANS